jgi:glycosyltransferase involved in cell wall biosynthesis
MDFVVPKMTVSPKVSVVIAAYNAAAFVADTLESVLAQTLADIEVIVVNDGSTDCTKEVVRGFPDRRLILLEQRNAGVSSARNTGLAAARAPYVLFLDADDLLLPTALSQMTGVLDARPDRVACFAHHIRIAEDGAELSRREDIPLRVFPADDTLRHLATKNFIVCGAICARTSAARRLKGFDTTLHWGEDWEFWCRLAMLGDFAAMPNDIVLMYRQHGSSTNLRSRCPALHPDFRAIDAVFSNPALQQRFTDAKLNQLRRLAQIDAFWTGVRNVYVQGRTGEFLACLVVGALRYPDSILRPRLVYLFIRALQRQFGHPVTLIQRHPQP